MKILVADDNHDIADSVAMALEMWHHTVTVARTGQGAIDLALSDPPDVAMLDIGMPDLSGFEVCERIRRELGDRPVIVAVTGWGDSEYRNRAQRVGFDTLLLKPIGIQELLRVVDLAKKRGL